MFSNLSPERRKAWVRRGASPPHWALFIARKPKGLRPFADF